MAGTTPYKISDCQPRIIEALLKGSTYILAAQYAGISYDTFYSWMKKGEREETQEAYEFFKAVKKAEADAAMKWLDVIDAAAESDVKHWTACAWKLERRQPKSYASNAQFNELKEELEELKSLIKGAKQNG